ncbi:hypothetical protein J4466_02460 [Candidatus Pacearchaeota archaeon]|nr:hypothetical protein [Candidatus Pacearchaeota archaeon]
MENYSMEVKEKIKEYKNKGFEFGKSERYLSHRISLSIKEVEDELNECKRLGYTHKKKVDGEIRYTLYFIYNKNHGRAYVLTFRDKIRIITAFPLGRKTLKKYFKRFINKNNLVKE